MAETARNLVLAIGMAVVATETMRTQEIVPTVTLRVSNAAHVRPDFLSQASERVKRIYADAGIAIEWFENDPPAPPAGLSLTIMLTPTVPPELVEDPSVMGLALQVAGRPGRVAYIALDRVEEYAHAERRDLATVLGHVIAHEVGHLLLALGAHAPTGIMRARWERNDMDEAERGQLTFTGQQAARMRQQLANEPIIIASR